ncbi:MAG: hypothetical protein PHO15_01030 [Eubacteriales bacterium]|nr:hypothetical protein [Eubacteriales bacterium]
MSISGVGMIQTMLLQKMTADAYEDTESLTSFSDLLSDAINTDASDSKKANTAAYDMFSSLFNSSGDTAGMLLASLLTSYSGSSSNMMLLSLGNALYNTSEDDYTVLQTSAASSTSILSSGSGYIPAAASIPAEPAITSDIYNRDADLYRAVIDQFSVETNARYAVNKKGTGDTYCNIFVWDVTSAMGAEIPHYYNAKTGEPMTYSDDGANEMTANAIYKWLHQYGEKYGWYEVSGEEAQELANDGHPVVTALYNSSGHGHVQVVCPSEDGEYNEELGVTIAQAGRRLRNYCHITDIYNASLSKVSCFAHI